MKGLYIAKYRHGLLGDTVVSAEDADEAKREAVAACRMHSGCIPEYYGNDDVVASVEPAEGAVPPSCWNASRPVVEVGRDEFAPPSAADVLKNMAAPDFSAVSAV